MAILGAHMSMAGGYYKAVEAAAKAGCDCVQLFTKNNNQWRAKEITPAEIERFRTTLETLKITHPISHDSYLINLASPKEELWQKSLEAYVIELQRAEMLGIFGVVMHPGSYTSTSEEEGLQKIITALDEVHRQTAEITALTLLETTAGQGTNLGNRFEHLATILDGVEEPDRIGICVDTCHIFAAGYSLHTEQEYNETMRQFDQTIGLQRIKAFHLNDSLKPFGSRVDRHAGIGLGEMGIEPFRFLLNDSRFEKIPMYLETPKGENEEGESLDVINLRTLRGLIV